METIANIIWFGFVMSVMAFCVYRIFKFIQGLKNKNGVNMGDHIMSRYRKRK